MRSLTRLALTFLAGFCDTASFIHMHGVFSAHVTGNFVVFAASLAEGLNSSDYLKLICFPVFVAAVAFTSIVFTRASARGGNPLARVLLLFALALILSALLASIFGDTLAAFVTLLVVFAMGMQNTLHHFIPGPMTTVMTGTVMNTVAKLTKKLVEPQNAVLPATPPQAAGASPSTLKLICAFALGCVISAIFTKYAGYNALWLPAVMAAAICWIESGKIKPAPTGA